MNDDERVHMERAIWPMRVWGALGMAFALASGLAVVVVAAADPILGLGLLLAVYDAVLAFRLLTTRRTRFGVLDSHSFFFRHLRYRLLAAVVIGAVVVCVGAS